MTSWVHELKQYLTHRFAKAVHFTKVMRIRVEKKVHSLVLAGGELKKKFLGGRSSDTCIRVNSLEDRPVWMALPLSNADIYVICDHTQSLSLHVFVMPRENRQNTCTCTFK